MSALAELIPTLAGRRVAVLGDLVADEYIHGVTERISREAPVLIVREERREVRPGGAANVAANLAALGGAPRLIGLVGADPAGQALRAALTERGVELGHLVTDAGRGTTTKTRVVAGGLNTVRQQMLRLDRLAEGPPGADARARLLAALAAALEGADGLVVSDYAEGVVAGEVLAAVLERAAAGRLPVFADSRLQVAAFRGVEALTPNEPELALASGIALDGALALERAARVLLEQSGARAVLVKRGKNGMALVEPGRPLEQVAAFGGDEVADVTGAGDTVLATFSLASLAGAPFGQAMRLANAAGGLKVQKAGTAVVTAAELARALDEAGESA
jgi:rfaE bifunctional protein kinase chain/domain